MRRFGIIGGLVLIAAAPPPPTVQTTGVDVSALVRQARLDYATLKKDAFAARTLNDAVAGKAFGVTIIPHNGDTMTGEVSNGSFYSYQDRRLELHLDSTQIAAPSSADPNQQYLQDLEFLVTNRSSGRQVGTNGYGARVAFDSRSIQSSGLAVVGGDSGLRIEWSKMADGPVAKAIALGSKFVVHGVIAKLPNGHVGACATHYAAATVDSPTELVELNCYVGATIISVDLIGPSGPVHTWTMDTRDGRTTPTAAATPKGNSADWITSDDYPPSALRDAEQGSTSVTLAIDESGRVSGCTITSSSNYPDLDAAACMLLPRRARFTPAKDVGGNGVASTYSMKVPWRIPKA